MSREFQPGDWVIVNNEGSSFYHRIGIVKEKSNKLPVFKVKLREYPHAAFWPSELKLLSAAETKP